MTSSTLLTGIRAGLPPAGPETIHLDITNGCDAACVTCWDHSPRLHVTKEPSWKSRRAELTHLLRAIDEAMSLGCLRKVIVSGAGEPCLHPEINNLLSGLKERGLQLTLITNLIHTDVDQLVAVGVDALLVGVHGASEDVWSAFHPGFKAHHWQILLDKLQFLKSTPVQVKHVQVICGLNCHQVTEMIELGALYGAARVGFKLASLTGGTETVAITDAQRMLLLQEWIPAGIVRAAKWRIKHNLTALKIQLEAGGLATAPMEETGCYMGHLYARITVDGDVLFCCNHEAHVGRLVNGRGLAALWQGEAWNHLRQRLDDGEFFPGCARCGKFEQNLKISRELRLHGEKAVDPKQLGGSGCSR